MSQRVLAIGYDGGTFALLKPWAEEGYLPTLGRLFGSCAWSTLLSTVPPNTGPAWSSFMTGKNPGKHGVTDFRGPLGPDFTRPLLSSRSIRSRKLWDILSRGGKRIVVLNVPMTYPVEPVDGIMVSGMLTPRVSPAMTYPAEFFPTLQNVTGGYRFALHWEFYKSEEQIEAFIQDLHECTDKLQALNRHLIEKEPWDFFLTVFDGMDRIQHLLWKILDPAHPLAERSTRERYLPLILGYYQKVDRYLGELIEAAGREAAVFLFSDHGFGPLAGKFHLNTWLIEQGFLSLKKGAVQKWRRRHRVRASLARAMRRIDRWEWRKALFRTLLEDRIDALSLWVKSMSETYSPRHVDWARTQAYSAGPVEQGVFVNLQGREPAGIVPPGKPFSEVREQVALALRTLEDPRSGGPLVTDIFFKEDVYRGPLVERCPDVFFVLAGHRYTVSEEYFQSGELFSPSPIETGYHRPEGILMACAPWIRPGHRPHPARIEDLAPTFLFCLGLPVPDDMDGRVLADLFEKEFLERAPLTMEKTVPEGGPPEPAGEKKVFTEDEEERIKQQLRGLGYMD